MPPRTSRGSSKDSRTRPLAKLVWSGVSNPGMRGHVARLVADGAVPLEALGAPVDPSPTPGRGAVVDGDVPGGAVDVGGGVALDLDGHRRGGTRGTAGERLDGVDVAVEVAEGVAQAAADAPPLAQVVGHHRMDLVEPELGAAGEEAAREEPRVPVEAVVEGRVVAEAEGERAALRLPGDVEGGRELDDVAGVEVAGRAVVVVVGLFMSRPASACRPASLVMAAGL